MKNKVQGVIITMLVCCFILSTSALAATVNKTISLPAGTWVSNKEQKSNASLSYGIARCVAVYPVNGKDDNYTKIKVRTKSGGQIISAQQEYILTEGDTATTIYYKKLPAVGDNVNMQFRGNSDNLSAKADVVYNVN